MAEPFFKLAIIRIVFGITVMMACPRTSIFVRNNLYKSCSPLEIEKCKFGNSDTAILVPDG